MVRNNQAGFTLIELLVVVAIIGILGGIGSQAYVMMKERAYYASSERVLQDARTSLEAGTINEAEFAGLQVVNQDVPGPVEVGVGRVLVPGLVLPETTTFMVQHDPDCKIGACLAEFISVRNCKINRYTYWFRLGSGSETLLQSVAALGAC